MLNLDKYSHLIALSIGKTNLLSKSYNTNSIMQVIFSENERAYLDVVKFARAIPYNNVRELSEAIYNFVKKNIRYKEDGMTYQAIKSPARLWADKEGDCKSFSIFAAAVLKACGVPYSFRFVNYDPSMGSTFTHVYIISHGPGADYIIDPVWTKGPFNTQKQFSNKKDFLMDSGLYSLGATRRVARKTKSRRRGVLQLPKNLNNEAAFELAIIRQRLEIERNIMEKAGRSAKVSGIDRSLDVLDEFIGAVESEDYDTMDSIISGINGRLKDKIKATLNKAKQKVKAAAKTLVKVVTAPGRLAAKGALELMLPSAAPTFLYLFIPSDKLRLLPGTVQSKYAKQAKIADFIVNGLGMKRAHLMGIIRNGIMKRMGKSPEDLLSEQFKGIMGIGVVGVATLVASLLPKLIELIKKIGKVTGKNTSGLEGDANAMLPAANDFAGLASNVVQNLSSQLKRKDSVETAPGKMVEAFESIEQSGGDIIPQDGGKTGPRGWC